jgi:hypothetical protein
MLPNNIRNGKCMLPSIEPIRQLLMHKRNTCDTLLDMPGEESGPNLDSAQ